MATGQGKARSNMVKATRSGRFPNAYGTSQGETSGAGSIFAAELNERPNTSNPRNQGPVRGGSLVGESTIPIATFEDRQVDKIT